jgi:lipopolysaccharide export system protein LptA
MIRTARSCRTSARLSFAALAVLALALQPVMAKQSDRNEPINVVSKTTDATQGDTGLAIFTGSVVITQGTLKVTGNIAHVYMDKDNNIVRAVVDGTPGTPATIHELDDNGNNIDGHSANLDYQVQQNVAILTGNAYIKQQGRGEANGDKLVYNTDTSNITGTSNGDNVVKMQFLPKPKPPAGTPATPAAAPAKPAAAPASASTAAKP